MYSPSVPPFVSRHVFAFPTDDVARTSELLRLARLAQSHHLLNASLLSELVPLAAGLPFGLPRSRAALHGLQHDFARLHLCRQRSLHSNLRVVLFAPCGERPSVNAALRTLRFLAAPFKHREETLRQLASLVRLAAERCLIGDEFAKCRLDAGLFAAITSTRSGAPFILPSPQTLLTRFATAQLLLAGEAGPNARDGEQRLPLRGGRVELPSGGVVNVNARIAAGVCLVRIYNIGPMEVWVTRVEAAATSPSELQVLLPPPTLPQRVLGKQPSLIVRGGVLGRAGELWAAVWVR